MKYIPSRIIALTLITSMVADSASALAIDHRLALPLYNSGLHQGILQAQAFSGRVAFWEHSYAPRLRRSINDSLAQFPGYQRRGMLDFGPPINVALAVGVAIVAVAGAGMVDGRILAGEILIGLPMYRIGWKLGYPDGAGGRMQASRIDLPLIKNLRNPKILLEMLNAVAKRADRPAVIQFHQAVINALNAPKPEPRKKGQIPAKPATDQPSEKTAHQSVESHLVEIVSNDEGLDSGQFLVANGRLNKIRVGIEKAAPTGKNWARWFTSAEDDTEAVEKYMAWIKTIRDDEYNPNNSKKYANRVRQEHLNILAALEALELTLKGVPIDTRTRFLAPYGLFTIEEEKPEEPEEALSPAPDPSPTPAASAETREPPTLKSVRATEPPVSTLAGERPVTPTDIYRRTPKSQMPIIRHADAVTGKPEDLDDLSKIEPARTQQQPAETIVTPPTQMPGEVSGQVSATIPPASTSDHDKPSPLPAEIAVHDSQVIDNLAQHIETLFKYTAEPESTIETPSVTDAGVVSERWYHQVPILRSIANFFSGERALTSVRETIPLREAESEMPKTPESPTLSRVPTPRPPDIKTDALPPSSPVELNSVEIVPPDSYGIIELKSGRARPEFNSMLHHVFGPTVEAYLDDLNQFVEGPVHSILASYGSVVEIKVFLIRYQEARILVVNPDSQYISDIYSRISANDRKRVTLIQGDPTVLSRELLGRLPVSDAAELAAKGFDLMYNAVSPYSFYSPNEGVSHLLDIADMAVELTRPNGLIYDCDATFSGRHYKPAVAKGELEFLPQHHNLLRRLPGNLKTSGGTDRISEPDHGSAFADEDPALFADKRRSGLGGLDHWPKERSRFAGRSQWGLEGHAAFLWRETRAAVAQELLGSRRYTNEFNPLGLKIVSTRAVEAAGKLLGRLEAASHNVAKKTAEKASPRQPAAIFPSNPYVDLLVDNPDALAVLEKRLRFVHDTIDLPTLIKARLRRDLQLSKKLVNNTVAYIVGDYLWAAENDSLNDLDVVIFAYDKIGRAKESGREGRWHFSDDIPKVSFVLLSPREFVRDAERVKNLGIPFYRSGMILYGPQEATRDFIGGVTQADTVEFARRKLESAIECLALPGVESIGLRTPWKLGFEVYLYAHPILRAHAPAQTEAFEKKYFAGDIKLFYQKYFLGEIKPLPWMEKGADVKISWFIRDLKTLVDNVIADKGNGSAVQDNSVNASPNTAGSIPAVSPGLPNVLVRSISYVVNVIVSSMIPVRRALGVLFYRWLRAPAISSPAANHELQIAA